MARRPPGERRDEPRRHRDARRWAVLRNRARGHVDVDVRTRDGLFRNAELIGVRLGVGERRSGGLFHDVAQLSSQHELTFAPHDARLDEHDVAADRRVVHAGGNAHLVFAGFALRVNLGASNQLLHVGGVHCDVLGLTVGDPPRNLARQLADLALQLPHAGLTRITRDDLAQRRVGDRQLLGGQTVLANLPRNQIPPGDLELLTLSVPREVDGLQAVEQWSRDALLEVRGRDEQHL